MNSDIEDFCTICWRVTGNSRYFCYLHAASNSNNAYHLKIKRRVLRTVGAKEGQLSNNELSKKFEGISYPVSKVDTAHIRGTSNHHLLFEFIMSTASRFYPRTFKVINKSILQKYDSAQGFSDNVLDTLSQNAPAYRTIDYGLPLVAKDSVYWLPFMLRLLARQESTLIVDEGNWTRGRRNGQRKNIILREQVRILIKQARERGERLKQKDIAALLGVSRGWISRIVKELDENGIQ